MNSENLLGVRIQWLTAKPSTPEGYAAAVKDVDYIVLNYSQLCPRIDGAPVDFTGAPNADKLEWLVKNDVAAGAIDFQLYYEDIVEHPTMRVHTEFSNYHFYDIVHNPVRRTNEEIISAIKQLENEANISVQTESDKNKTDMVYPTVLASLAKNIALTAEQQAVLNRVTEVSNRATVNADNAKNLIAIVNAGGTPDIRSGWQYDNITPQTAFYND